MRKNIVRTVFLFIALVLMNLSAAKFVSADGTYGQSGCVPVYGGGVQCPRVGQVLINKTVRNPSTGIFVDNLGPSDPKFHPENFIAFHLTVQNTGDQMLDKVAVTDTLPDFIDFTSGPGNFDSNSKTLTFDVLNLPGGTSQTFELVGRAVHESAFPQDKNLVCVVNNVKAVSSSQTDSDSSQFCIEKQMVVPAAPSAGPEYWILSFTGLATALTLGIYFRKKAVIS